MRIRLIVPIAGLAALAAAPAPAGAVVHTVQSGESLYSIAAADGLSVGQLAAANGLSMHSTLLVGANLTIPPRGAPATRAATAVGAANVAPVTSAVSPSAVVDGDGDHDGDASDDDGPTTRASASATAAGGRGYVVVPGDSLWAIAARSGTTVAALAAANGVSPRAPILPGMVLSLSHAPAVAHSQPSAPPAVGQSRPSASPAVAQSQPSSPPPTRASRRPPYPTPETLSATQIGQIGSDNGASWSLTDAIAWQESGFHNYAVAPDGGVGIMQVMPDTWQWIGHSLDTGAPLNPASASDNVRAGALLLHWLLNQTGGNPALAAAGYNEGLATLRSRGVIPQTQQYVRNVLALRARFGGG